MGASSFARELTCWAGEVAVLYPALLQRFTAAGLDGIR